MSQYKFEVEGWDMLPSGEFLVSVNEETGTATLAYRQSRLDRWSIALVPSEVNLESGTAEVDARIVARVKDVLSWVKGLGGGPVAQSVVVARIESALTGTDVES